MGITSPSFPGGTSGATGVFSDLEVDGTTIVVDETNNRVGIGPATPASTLEIEGSSGDLTIEIDNNVSNSENLNITSGAGNARADFVVDGNNHLTMKGQRVGIVSNNPQKTLDVTGDGQFSTDLTVGGDIIIDDGGSLKEAGGTAAITFDASGQVTTFNIPAAAVAQASDHIILLDGGATGAPKAESIDDFLTAIAGSGVSVSSSQLTASGGSANNDVDALLHVQVFS